MNARTALAITVAAFALHAAGAAADVPMTLSHDGFLTDTQGKPVAGAIGFTFNIYASKDGNDLLWGETIPGVQVNDGFYAVTLGLSNSLKGVFDSRKDVWLEVVVDGTTITPRQRISAVPYAVVAGDAVGDIHPASVTVNNTKVIDENGKWSGDPSGIPGVKNVATAAPLTGGPITDSGTIAIGRGSATADGYLAKEDFASFAGKQDKITGTCAGTGLCAAGVKTDGSIDCQPCPGGQSYTAGPGISITGASISLDETGCAAFEVLKRNAANNGWDCVPDDNTLYTAGPGLALTGTAFSLPVTCAQNTVLKWDGASWVCADYAPAAGGVQSVSAAPPLVSSGGANPTLSVAKASGTADGYLASADWTAFGQKQARVNGFCVPGKYIRVINVDGSVICDDDQNPSYGVDSGSGLVLNGGLFSLLKTCAPGNLLKWDGAKWDCAPDLAGGGTVTSVGLSMPAQFSVTNSPVTGSGTLTAAWATENANTVLAGPSSGAPAAPTFRALTDADIPDNITASNYLPLAGGTMTGNIQFAGAQTVDGVDISAHAADPNAHHARSHAVTSSSDHSATAWTVFYANAGGQVAELALGSSGTVLKSNGAAAAPSWQSDSVGPTYSAGTGISISSNTVAVKNNSFACSNPNESIKTFNVDTGAVTCEIDDDTKYTAGTGLALNGTAFSLQTCAANKILVFDGANWICVDYACAAGGVQGVTASAPIASSGGTTPNISLTGTVPVANGGTGASTAFTQGSVVFAGSGGAYAQDNGNLFWDDTNNRLGVGTPTPATALQVVGTARASGFSAADGTAGSPSYYFASDANSGVFLAAADNVGISAGGTERLRVDGVNGRVGIGTSVPGSTLDVNGDATVNGSLKGTVTNNYAETDSQVSNTSNASYVNATSVSLAAGDYLLFSSVEAGCSGCFCVARLRNATDGANLGGDSYLYDDYSAGAWAAASWVKKISIAATKTIAIQQKIETGGAGTCYTRNARIFALRVGP